MPCPLLLGPPTPWLPPCLPRVSSGTHPAPGVTFAPAHALWLSASLARAFCGLTWRGRLLQIRLVNEEGTGKPRGYAFVEFQHTRDMKGETSNWFGRHKSPQSAFPLFLLLAGRSCCFNFNCCNGGPWISSDTLSVGLSSGVPRVCSCVQAGGRAQGGRPPHSGGRGARPYCAGLAPAPPGGWPGIYQDWGRPGEPGEQPGHMQAHKGARSKCVRLQHTRWAPLCLGWPSGRPVTAAAAR